MANSTEPLTKSALSNRFRRMIGGAQDGITILENGKVLCLNERQAEIVGYSQTELVRMDDLAFAAPEELARVRRSLQEADAQGLPLTEVEFWALRKDGTRRQVRSRYFRWTGQDGVPRFLVMTSDITRPEPKPEPVQQVSARQDLSGRLFKISQALASASNPDEMLRVAVTPAVETGAHAATLMYVDVGSDGRPEWAETVAAIGGTAAPVGWRFYLPESPQASLFFADPHRPLMVGDLYVSHQELPQDVVRIMTAVQARAFVSMPLMAGDRWQGLVTVAWPRPQQFGSEEESLYRQIGSQLSAAVQGHRLRKAAEHRAVWSQTAAEVSQAAASVLESDVLLERVVNLVHERFDLYYVALFLVGEGVKGNGVPGQWAVLRVGTGQAGQQMVEQDHKLEIGGASMIGQCLATKQPRIAMDVGMEAVHFANPLLPDTRTELALPLISRGQALGALSIQSTQAAAFSPEDIAVLQTMADQLAIAIDNADMIRRAQSRAEQERRVRDITERVHRSADAGTIMRVAVEELGRMLGASKAVIRLGTQDQLIAGSGEPSGLED